MTKELFAKAKNKVIPFEQNGEFFYRKAQKHLENNNYIDALTFYRKAVEKDPNNVDYMLDLAEVFTEMGYFEESNRILFFILQKNNEIPDCYFGLGCNFLGLQHFEKAEECLMKYISLDEDGLYYEEARDLLDVIQSNDLYEDDYEDISEFKEKLYISAGKGKDHLDKGEYKKAIRYLEKVVSEDPTIVFARNNLALAYFCLGEIEKAIKISDDIIKEYPQNIHANCNICIFYYENNNMEKCDEKLKTILNFETNEPDELHKIAVTLCELKQHEQGNRMLRKLLQFKPYDIRVLHYLSVSYFNLGKYKEAQLYWNKIDKILPENTISSFYQKYARDYVKEGGEHRDLPYHFQVPYEEIIRRVKKINDMLRLPKRDLINEWERGVNLRTLLRWGLDLNDSIIKKAILNVVASFEDKQAETFLREFILRRGEEKANIKEAITLLKKIDAEEPYIAYMDDNIVEVKVNIMDINKSEVSTKILQVADITIEFMKYRYESGYENTVKELWVKFINAVSPNNIPKVQKSEGWAAALELLYCKKNNISITKKILTQYYGITYYTLNKNYQRLVNIIDI